MFIFYIQLTKRVFIIRSLKLSINMIFLEQTSAQQKQLLNAQLGLSLHDREVCDKKYNLIRLMTQATLEIIFPSSS